MEKLEVVAAVIVNEEGQIFCAQRANKGIIALKWEFPGGKVEPDESKQHALVREIKEELNALININNYIMTVEYPYETFHLTMHAYLCEIIDGELVLKEHIDSVWLPKESLKELDWAEADIPIVEKLLEIV